jgi:hypothetical protein
MKTPKLKFYDGYPPTPGWYFTMVSPIKDYTLTGWRWYSGEKRWSFVYYPGEKIPKNVPAHIRFRKLLWSTYKP